MPVGFRVQSEPDVWTPLPLDGEHTKLGSHILRVIARRKTGVTLAQSIAEMDVIGARIAAIAPETNASWGVTVDPLQPYLMGTDLRTTSLALSAAVAFLLLLSCVNVANVLRVRGAGRVREIAVRAALGASRGRIVSQLLAESLLLAMMGGAVGLWIANMVLDVAPRVLPQGTLPAAAVLQLDARMVWFTLAASIITGLLFGIAPAWASSAARLSSSMRTGGRGISSGGGVRNLLASAEIALAVVLLSGAGLLAHTLFQLERADRSYEPGNVLTMRMSLPKSRYATNDRAVEFFKTVDQDLENLPGVRSAGFSVDIPLAG